MGLNWGVFAIQRLKDYNSRLNAFDSLKEQISALEDSFKAVRSAQTDKLPIQGGNLNNREEMLIENIAKREELNINLELVNREIEITEKGLSVLSDTERKILNLFYMERPKGYIDRLCDELFISKTELYRQKDAALKKFTIACYGIVEL